MLLANSLVVISRDSPPRAAFIPKRDDFKLQFTTRVLEENCRQYHTSRIVTRLALLRD